MEQLSTTTTEPARLEPVLHNKRGHDSERPAHSDEEWPPLAATRESPSTETRSEEHTSELQSLTTISYAVFCLKKKKKN